MMTVLTRTRVPRDKFFETSPRWLEDPTYTTQGSAKPGRGGRRKRRRRAAGMRARVTYCAGMSAALFNGLLLPRGIDTLFQRSARLNPDPTPRGTLGRRERRRRAKLRRRRARRERALVRTLKAVGMWGQNRISRLVTSGADPTVKLYGVARTPGV